MKEMHTAYISLGSNQGERFYNLQEAVFLMGKRLGSVTQISRVYENAAIGFEGDDFYNACIELETAMEPTELMSELLKIETEMGRTRTPDEGYASRSLDLDILYYDDIVIANDTVTIPHPKLQERRFVLKPLCDIAPNYYHPQLKKDSRNLLQQCSDQSPLRKLDQNLTKTELAFLTQLQFLTIEGNIGAGKTTLTHMLAEDFNAKLVLERFADNPFLPKFYKDPNRYAFPLEMSFLADRYQQFTDDTSQFDLFKNFMVSDYDIRKSLIFAKVTLPEEEFRLYRKLFDFMYKEVKKPDIYVYLYQNTERLLANIRKRGRGYEQEISPDYLEKINKGYFEFIKGSPDRNALVIDVSELDFVERPTDYGIILQALKKFMIRQLF
ncbi:2-amino-4-hydroxy-6-hydroxymethyldihydropteridine diphosphokinase [Sediminicola luteus]|uniref:2-amino-4-hydroxy-6-hydroxymethyldihydropteridine pyrophosphokinase n=1 Tax=Sediminicola luteus TaxID=319238 RepID=A0A2A4G4A6_9FLAO|nr:2-amino-4-hydroxy-6-hydroxymethyldihydropteridine diphosphokinase [Sediminicola luteus]PCE63273.1 2-amino-4-hydroxy-6-hydroxymethyldihydropteridine diphosphokinase [Sediminicola luteus]